jgi:hypothetical protein
MWDNIKNFFDSNFFQAVAIIVALILAYLIGRKQNRINDTVELYATYGILQNGENTTPIVHVQNVGTRLIYIDKYIFNEREYKTDGQILPSTYSQALNNFYRIDLPTNQEIYVSLEFFYHDLDNRYWSSIVYCKKDNNLWEIKTLPRKKLMKFRR